MMENLSLFILCLCNFFLRILKTFFFFTFITITLLACHNSILAFGFSYVIINWRILKRKNIKKFLYLRIQNSSANFLIRKNGMFQMILSEICLNYRTNL